MKITRIETIPVKVPVRAESQIIGGLGNHLESPFVILRVHTDDDIVGLGEVSCTPVWSGEDSVTAVQIIRTYLEPVVVGQDPLDIELLRYRMSRAVFGHPFTKSGVEIALWDILGKAAGLPLYKLFGGAVRENIPIKMSISGVEPDKAKKLADIFLKRGVKALKVKVGIEPESDIARVKAVREHVGPALRLGIDANGGWSPRIAIQCIRRMYEQSNIYFAEQPVAPLDLQWMVDVRRASPVPVMADESCFNLQDAMAIVRAQAADLLSIYVGKGGGLGTARKMAAVAEAAGLTCVVGSNLELGIASAAMAHLAISSRAFQPEEIPCDIVGGAFGYENDIVTEPLQVIDGCVRPSDKPGLGVEIDESMLKRYKT
jgi:L-alanine-DL-glutamate epimerase-like enolase superfamily enzyme